jgi:hypothetical protein
MSRSKHEQRPKSWKMNLYVYIEWNFFFLHTLNET